MKYITRTIWILSLVSFFTDAASEMLYPVMPLFLKSIGFSVFLIGILEGLAELIAGLSKGYFGQWSDAVGRRLPFVRLGYFLSALSKPLITLATAPAYIFSVRSLDRIGKGIRTAPRDALLADAAEPKYKGRIFGFHRSLDTLGAVVGPLIALLYLLRYPNDYKTLFLLAAIPGLFAVAGTWLLAEKRHKPQSVRRVHFFSFFKYWRLSGKSYRSLVAPLLLFALVNSSDLFLILKAKEAGVSDQNLLLYYILYNLTYAVAAWPLGGLADRAGYFVVMITGLLVFTVVYTLMALGNSSWHVLLAFFLYGLYAAGTEGVAKAWITSLVPKTEYGTALGFYTAGQSIAALVASSLMGLVWSLFGSGVAFAGVALWVLLVVVWLCKNHQQGLLPSSSTDPSV